MITALDGLEMPASRLLKTGKEFTAVQRRTSTITPLQNPLRRKQNRCGLPGDDGEISKSLQSVDQTRKPLGTSIRVELHTSTHVTSSSADKRP